MNLRALATELSADPLGRGYSGMSDAAVITSLNTINRSVERKVIPAYEVINATVATDWTALSAAERLRYQTITGAGDIDVQNPNVRAAFLAMFPSGSTTRSNLAALQTTLISRATELGLGEVHVGDVTYARTL